MTKAGFCLAIVRAPVKLTCAVWSAVAAALLCGLCAGADSTLVFNEIMYHPAGDEAALEWVELHNQMAVDLDISSWRVAGGIGYVFPEGTIVPGRGFVVVAVDPAALMQATGLTGVHGPFTGRLDNGGETLELRNKSGRLMDLVRYNDGGNWSVAADGSGVSLAKRDPNAASARRTSWVASGRVGGTPGAANFLAADDPHATREGLVSYWSMDDPVIGAGVYTEDFQEPNGAPADWAAADGVVSIYSNELRLQGGGAESWAWAGIGGAPFSFSDIRAVNLRVNFAGVPGDEVGRHGGVMVCASEPGTRYSASGYIIDWIDRTGDRGYRIYRGDAGNHSFFVPGSGHAQPGTIWRIEFDSTTFRFLVDGVEIGRYTDGAYRTGYVGAWCYSSVGQDLRIDDVQVEYAGAVHDAIGGNAGLVGAGAVQAAGLVGAGALDFANTQAAFVDVGPGVKDGFAVTAGITIEALIKPGWAGSSGDADMIFRKDDGANRILLGFQHDGDAATRDVPLTPAAQPVLAFGINAGGVYRELDMPLDGLNGRPTLGGLRDGRAHHVVAAYDGVTGLKALYFDGIQCFSVTYPPGRFIASGGAARAMIGNSADGTEPFTGIIDEVAFWSRALSAEEVARHYANVQAGLNYLVPPGEIGDAAPRLEFNETSVQVGGFWIELTNAGGVRAALAGVRIAGSAGGEYVFGAQILDPGGFLVLTSAELGFGLAAGDKLFLYDAAGTEVLAAVALSAGLRSRWPDGTGRWFKPGAATPGAANWAPPESPVVINEIMFHPMDDPEEIGEYIELFNRSAAGTDISGWRFVNGVQFQFPEGTVLEAGGYLVVARDPGWIASRYEISNVVGPFVGRLANDEERLELVDAAGNTVNEVRYRDTWHPYADGGGSSLELRDSRADNTAAGAWAASDEGAKAQWETYSYRAVAAADRGPTQWNEFVFGLLDEGALLIDDIHVYEAPSGARIELIQNPAFETGAAKWRCLGTHRHAQVVVDPDNPANHALALVASGPTGHMHNHVETTLANGRTVVNGREYEISFRAKWLGGCNLLHTRLYFNRAARTTALALPARRGTPGARNSVAEDNIGPTWGLVRHAPAVPQPAEPVIVTAEASDPDGVGQCVLWWSVNGGQWQHATMTEREGVFRGTIPGEAAGATIQFYLEGLDMRGAFSLFPPAGPDSRALIRVDDGQARLEKLHNLRIIMTKADADFLHLATNVMSNDRLGATVLYDERDIVYDAGVRLKSSQRGRLNDARVGFNVRFPREQLFRGVHRTLSIDRSGGWGLGIQSSQDEILIKHIGNHAGYIPTMYDDIGLVIAPRRAQTRPALFMMASYNARFLDGQWENGSSGDKYKYELVYYPTTTVDGSPESLKLPQPDNVTGVDLQALGPDKEMYRWFFLKDNNPQRDDWAGIIALCNVFSSPQIEQAARQTMDVSEWMRVFVLYALCGINDTYMYGNYHNNIHYVRPSDGKVLVFPWDMDWSWSGAANAPLWGNMNLQKVITRTPFTRMYYGHFKDIIATTFNRAYMDRWIQHYGYMAGQNYGAVSGIIEARGNYVLGQIPAGVPFAITTNGGADFTVDADSTTLQGTAPVEIAAMFLGDAEVAPNWSTTTRWSLAVALRPGVNRLEFSGRDVHGAERAATAITITSTANWHPPEIDILVPAEGPERGGATVQLYGSNFQPGMRAWFGAVEARSVTVLSPIQAQAVTPPGVGLVEVTAANPDGGTSAEGPVYTYIAASEPEFIRGDANADGRVDISDPVKILSYLFGHGVVSCEDALDANDDGSINIGDAIYLLGYNFTHRAAPPPPFPECGPDPTEDTLRCDVFGPCP
ncbi:MAG TPA: lamin tail domain-containing protein [Planctomycetota bacterium]|jgi:hypothetical protein|nr:lamin tail domain-containing protein [Planctomycetota bacterium]OQC20691.1 MAG: CotH protein [Planctomycetes bacterium ADurb.Bin069]NMD35302.1 hypothetical protein [Planctomycetota bacterium]HNR98302.1 lamin tail domain-containing protein [Planctomycetota bacterium]HNU24620.1 lamin tail domain-containing protein [Planctomycetota bacterium]